MNKITVALLFSLLAFTAKAQIGIIAGINFSQAAVDADSKKPILAPNFGLNYQIKKKSIEFAPEVAYTVKGVVKYPPTSLSNNVLKYTNHDSYLQFTLLVQKTLDLSDATFDDFSFQFGAGPYVGYLLKSVTKEERYTGVILEHDNKIGTDVKALDMGLRIFIGFGIGNLQTQIKYERGLTNANITGNSYHNKLTSFSFIYRFGDTD